MTTQKQIYDEIQSSTATTEHKRLQETAVAGISISLLAVLTALSMPYGPITTAQVWIFLASCLAVGLIAGFVLRSPWAMLIAPLIYIIIFELARPNGLVPTTGMPRLDNSYGLLALIVGREFHGLVSLLPLILGVGLGILLARYQSGALGSTSRTFLQAIPLVLLAVVVLGITILNGIPASTPPNPTPHSLPPKP